MPRYFFWRTFNTLTYYDPLSFASAILLYFAEVYRIVIYLLGLFVNIHPFNRKPKPLPSDPDKLPAVDA